MKRFPTLLTVLFFACACLMTSIASAQNPLNVWIKIPSSIQSNGIVSGTTNLPDGTTLSLALAGPAYSQFNRDNSAYAATVAVAHGTFGPVSIVANGVYPPPGNYIVSIIMQDWSMQPQNVIAIIGRNAVNLTGSLVIGGPNPNVEASLPVIVR